MPSCNFLKLILYSYKPIFSSFEQSEKDRFGNNIQDSEIFISQGDSNRLEPAQNYEGIMDIFNEAPPGKKLFCGKQIEVTFQHVLETQFSMIQIRVSRENAQQEEVIYESEYYSSDEDHEDPR